MTARKFLVQGACRERKNNAQVLRLLSFFTLNFLTAKVLSEGAFGTSHLSVLSLKSMGCTHQEFKPSYHARSPRTSWVYLNTFNKSGPKPTDLLSCKPNLDCVVDGAHQLMNYSRARQETSGVNFGPSLNFSFFTTGETG